MSVLECRRGNCGHIMCGRYSYTYEYICNRCFEQLVKSGPGTDIEAFMDSEIEIIEHDIENARIKYDKEFLCHGGGS